MNNFTTERKHYIQDRLKGGCSCCGASVNLDPISQLCFNCKSKYLSHGSPSVPKPTLEIELDLALIAIRNSCHLKDAEVIFDRWMLSFANPTKTDALRRLCWLHFVEIKNTEGVPVMTFKDVIQQALAVTIYERNGGKIDHKRKQYHYLLGRSVCTVWNKQRRIKQLEHYDKSERRYLQRRPRLFHQAFNDIFLGAGVAKFIAKINRTLKI